MKAFRQNFWQFFSWVKVTRVNKNVAFDFFLINFVKLSDVLKHLSYPSTLIHWLNPLSYYNTLAYYVKNFMSTHQCVAKAISSMYQVERYNLYVKFTSTNYQETISVTNTLVWKRKKNTYYSWRSNLDSSAINII